MISRRAALGGLAAGAGIGMGVLPWPAGAVAPWPAAASLHTGVFAQGGWARGEMLTPAVSLALDGVALKVDSDRKFFIAFDRDAGPEVTLSGVAANGEPLAPAKLAIAPGHWPIEAIDAPFHPPALPDADFARIRAGELARITAARTHDTGAQGWRQTFIWPVKGRVSGRFGAQRVYRGTPGSYHPGLDIATGESGTPYVAPADGVVVLAATPTTGGPFTLEGNLLMIDHGMGLSSAFLHSSALLVAEGDKVAQGQPIGHIGMTGRATGPHLHWGLRWREARLDPALMLGEPAAQA